MSSLKIRIPFTPKPKASVQKGKSGWYNPSYKSMNITKRYVKKALEGTEFELLKGPLLVIVHFRIPAPISQPSHSREPRHLLPHLIRPDGDNLEKFLNDSLNGVVWADDSRIVWLLRSKTITKAKVGETIIHVKQLDNALPHYDAILSEIREHICICDEDDS
jgi:Holliday junction resolvase RusA-like endonuclease